jgi:hypothetical protein
MIPRPQEAIRVPNTMVLYSQTESFYIRLVIFHS